MQHTNPQQIIRSTMRDFANLIRNMFSEKTLDPVLNSESYESSILVSSHRFGTIAARDHLALEIIERLTAFWLSRSVDYRNALLTLPGYRVATEILEPKAVSQLLTYFDSIIMYDDVISYRRMVEDPKKLGNMISGRFQLYKALLPFFETELDQPLVLIFPLEFEYADDSGCMKEVPDILNDSKIWNVANDMTAELLNSVSRENRNWKLSDWLTEPNKSVEYYLDVERLSALTPLFNGVINAKNKTPKELAVIANMIFFESFVF